MNTKYTQLGYTYGGWINVPRYNIRNINMEELRRLIKKHWPEHKRFIGILTMNINNCLWVRVNYALCSLKN